MRQQFNKALRLLELNLKERTKSGNNQLSHLTFRKLVNIHLQKGLLQF